jgi:hypothetical protein
MLVINTGSGASEVPSYPMARGIVGPPFSADYKYGVLLAGGLTAFPSKMSCLKTRRTAGQGPK